MTTSLSSHQLIIVGNGFDIECGLKSQFSDFFAPRFENIDNITDYSETAWCESVKEAGLTVWDFILRRNPNSNWFDVEEAIKRWVQTPGEVIPANVHRTSAAAAVHRYPYAHDPFVLNGNRLPGEERENTYVYNNIARRIWMLIDHADADSFSEKELFPILRSELELLENSFEEYLRKEQSSNPDYQSNSRKLFNRIACDLLPDLIHSVIDTSVLTFNYTNPFTDRLVGPGLDDTNVVNIHGHLNGETIFGIDGANCMDDDNALPFTKTYRVAMAGNQVRHSLFHSGSKGDGIQTDFVKFYGHSLGEPDYSYFQSIFDGINLYGGRTRLVFYYRPWIVDGRPVPEDVVRTDSIRKVANLLSAYGKTLDNKDHGKNLMHKLMLEGRLQVKRI